MKKGAVVLKTEKYGKWVRIFRWFVRSGKGAVVIHCKDFTQARYVQRSAQGFKERTGEMFWSHTIGNDLYLLRPDAIINSAVEVMQDEDTMSYYFYERATDTYWLEDESTTNHVRYDLDRHGLHIQSDLQGAESPGETVTV